MEMPDSKEKIIKAPKSICQRLLSSLGKKAMPTATRETSIKIKEASAPTRTMAGEMARALPGTKSSPVVVIRTRTTGVRIWVWLVREM